MKKTAGIIVLIVLFVYSAVKGLDVLIRSSATADYYVFASNGLTPLFFIYAAAAFILDALTVYFLFRPRPLGFYTALSSLALSLVYGVATFILVLADLPGVKNAYAAGREARGLPVRRETLDLLLTPAAWGIVWAATVLFLGVIAFLVFRNRRYFMNVFTQSGDSTLVYGHMSRTAVVSGQSVQQGQLLGYIGCTGVCTGPHLHFEVRLNGQTVDPLGLLP